MRTFKLRISGRVSHHEKIKKLIDLINYNSNFTEIDKLKREPSMNFEILSAVFVRKSHSTQKKLSSDTFGIRGEIAEKSVSFTLKSLHT